MGVLTCIEKMHRRILPPDSRKARLDNSAVSLCLHSVQGAIEAFGNTQLLWCVMDGVFRANTIIRQEAIDSRDKPELSRQDARMP